MRRCLTLAAAVLPLAAAPAHAQVFAPPSGKVFTGMSGSTSATSFTADVGKHPTVFGVFTFWNADFNYAFKAAEQADSRLMLHISTNHGYGEPEVITPRGIARGSGDGYLIALNRRIASINQPVYIRLMAEMNQTNNAYCAFNRNGSSRGPAHSTANFKQAFRRSAIILRGGTLASINAKLKKLH